MQDTLHLVAVAAFFPMMALALSLPFYAAAWLRSRRHQPTELALLTAAA